MCVCCDFQRQKMLNKLNSRNKAICSRQQLSAPRTNDLFKTSYLLSGKKAEATQFLIQMGSEAYIYIKFYALFSRVAIEESV